MGCCSARGRGRVLSFQRWDLRGCFFTTCCSFSWATLAFHSALRRLSRVARARVLSLRISCPRISCRLYTCRALPPVPLHAYALFIEVGGPSAHCTLPGGVQPRLEAFPWAAGMVGHSPSAWQPVLLHLVWVRPGISFPCLTTLPHLPAAPALPLPCRCLSRWLVGGAALGSRWRSGVNAAIAAADALQAAGKTVPRHYTTPTAPRLRGLDRFLLVLTRGVLPPRSLHAFQPPHNAGFPLLPAMPLMHLHAYVAASSRRDCLPCCPYAFLLTSLARLIPLPPTTLYTLLPTPTLRRYSRFGQRRGGSEMLPQRC